MNDAVSLFLSQPVLNKQPPFPIRTANIETVEAINEPRERLKRYTSSQDMFDDILNENK